MGPRVRRAALLLPASALLLSACVARADGPSPAEGDDRVSSTSSTATTTTPASELAPTLDAYRGCLGGEGVTIDVIEVDGRGRPMMARAMSALDLTAPQVVAALGVCAPLVAGALDSSADPELESLVRANLEQFARCVRAEGVSDFPDPVRRFNGVGDPFPAARIPWTHPGLSEAVTVCGERILVHDG